MNSTPTKAYPMKTASKSGDQGGKINLYLPAGYLTKIDELLELLDSQGADVRDVNRPSVLSKSKLFQHLIDAELKRQGRDS
jgi:hypothetical protein